MGAEESVYEGTEKLVCFVDIGTTQSAVSLIHFQPGAVPRVRLVSRWPGELLSSKIPSLILYDASGTPKAHGASARESSAQSAAEEKGWSTCKYWKLYLHPATESSAPPPYTPLPCPTTSLLSCIGFGSDTTRITNIGRDGRSFELWPLPPGVDVEKIYRHWLRYLVKAARDWWAESEPDGESIWKKLEKTIVFVVSHPNGWGLTEQTVLSNALTKAVPTAKLEDSKNADRVMFVSEAEAAVHFNLHYPSSTSPYTWLSPDSEFMVVDAGGSTCDTSVYVVEKIKPKLKLRELKPSACVQAGAIFPTKDAYDIIKAKLAGSKYDDTATLENIINQFDTKTKHDFDDPIVDHVIKIDKDTYSDLALGIKRGRLTLKGSEVEAAFKTSVTLIIGSLNDQLEDCDVKTILLAGGFGETPYLQRRLREVFDPRRIQVITSNEPSKKAVAEGAAFHYIRESVVARATRFAFGLVVMRPVTDWPPDIKNVGKFNSFQDPSGIEKRRGLFRLIAKKGRVLETNEVVTTEFYQVFRTKRDARESCDEIYIRTSDNGRNLAFMIDSDVPGTVTGI